ncbi:TolC family protein [Undibacterium jejuense]|uniref:TolC family protein n=1 Tax=Undibacterium jejuense TaxID=1344949 RepID=A0A923KM58_9BURK|nr:TolC family protein [Undibacterium jejuense]MBC3863790.1 TolC family protein [Undibacterium jejuense]
MQIPVFSLSFRSILAVTTVNSARVQRNLNAKKNLKAGKLRSFARSLIYINLAMLSAHSWSAESLQQAWDVALQRDHTLAASQYRQQSAQHQVNAAQANYFPKVALETGYLRTEYEPAAKLNIPALPFLKGVALPFAQDSAYCGGVTVSAPIFTSGKISSGVAAAKAMADATEAHANLTRSELKLAIAQSYIAVLRAEHAVMVTTSYISAVQRHETDVQELFEHGYAAKHDLLATQVTLANARQLGLQASNALELARAAYNRWMGRPYEQVVQLQDIVNPTAIDDKSNLGVLLTSANEQRQELQELSKQSEAYKSQAASVRAGHLPQIGISGGYSKLENKYLAEDKGWWVGVVMKWDLFDGGLIRQQASALAANAQAVSEMEQDTRERIALQVRQSWLSHQEANARMQLVNKAVEQADESLALARERYRSGLAPNSEVLDAETSRLQAYSNRDNAIYDRELSRLQLQHAAGSL